MYLTVIVRERRHSTKRIVKAEHGPVRCLKKIKDGFQPGWLDGLKSLILFSGVFCGCDLTRVEHF